MPEEDVPRTPWWRGAAVYQLYLRSFLDSDHDGIGDIGGVIQRLPYLAGLGIDAIWLAPWYTSPMVDGGYDVADYRDIDPVFGTLAQAEHLVERAHEVGIKVIIDIVPNHCSAAHPWFRQALADGPGSPARDLFWFRPGRGPDGAQPPNDWPSRFGGPAWTRVVEPDGSPGEWYLHLYDAQQPDLNWDNPTVCEEFDDILRFWLDRGVDGFRIDVADALVKDPALPDLAGRGDAPHPYADVDGLHDIYRGWRKIIDTYPGERIFVAEIWRPSADRFAQYLRNDELHTAFNFRFLGCPWDAAALREVIDTTLATHAPVGAPPTWVLSNHDVTRHVTRYGRTDTAFRKQDLHRPTPPSDITLGTRRARAAAVLTMALPGSVYIYQGDELGLPEVEDLPDELRRDPRFLRTEGRNKGRDGCRVPLPWSGDAPPFGFTTSRRQAWLPQPADWSHRTVERQSAEPDTMLALYQRALTIRRQHPALGDGQMEWIPGTPPHILAFTRKPGFMCVVNLSPDTPADPPDTGTVILSSTTGTGSTVEPDSAAWFALT